MKRRSFLFLSAVACAGTAVAANINVPAGGNLQAALNSAKAGDTITLAAGATFTGNFTLAANAGPQWITIQSSAMGSLPAGTRVSASQASLMPKIVTANGSAALTATTGTNYYRIQGVEVMPASGVYGQDLIRVGTGAEPS